MALCRWCKSALKEHLFAWIADCLLRLQAPFEIYRLQIPANSIINAGRIVDTYCKQGGIFAYSTYFGLVPDLDIGISVLAAGEKSDRQIPPIRDTVVEIFVRGYNFHLFQRMN